ncbi:DUF2867 domain-containing protein [Undibacterium sp. TS12]|uniref:DUF2867 domain-containing protein n=1 Tax=Undibacterium sp. TS12 TaxID=2908202 RepID=UPI001F4CE710|nr:DUF2867 domain-containing protein [Undibacterium sp. TS12]MCH8620098.1 DUF2867 domain-containing protein [Undibacterium sp. TS12]
MPAITPVVEECEHPAQSVLTPDFVQAAYFRDAYRTVLSQPGLAVQDIFHNIFMHRPGWMKLIMITRNGLVSLFGIAAPSVTEIMHPKVKEHYAVGDKIGAWPIFFITPNELVAGRDNSHLDFRLSIFRENDGQTVVISTVCHVHNGFGRFYLKLIRPFHRWGVRFLIKRAVLDGRL